MRLCPLRGFLVRPAPREHGRRERVYLCGVARVRVQQLRRSRGSPRPLPRPRRVVPDDWDLCPSLANSLAAKHPILRGALVNSTVFPLMPVPGAAS